MSEQAEKICIQRFLDWYNEQYKRNYIHQRADTYFPDLKDKPNWDFVAYERGNPQEWIGIEIKELATVRETHIQLEFWRELCLELTKDLVGRGIQGEFGIFPPSFRLIHKDRPKFRKAFIEVLTNKESILKVDFTDIGPDIADKFTNWPKEKSRNLDEYDKWGEYRPSELQIRKSVDSGCKVYPLSSPIIGPYAVPEKTKEAFDELFKIDEVGNIQSNEQLKLAKEKEARETILLLACYPVVDEGLIKNQAQNLDRYLISEIDFIYLVDMGNKARVVRIYPD